MQWTDTGFILSVKKQGEHAALAHIFSRDHGLNAGWVNGAFSKANRPTYAPGNLVELRWQAKLSEQLGTYNCELLSPTAALVAADRVRLALLNAACSMVEATLPEREPHQKLFHAFSQFIAILTEKHEDAMPQHDEQVAQAYLMFEKSLLADLGFGLDLSTCALTGKTENLYYLSPKTGRACSKDAGARHAEQLFVIPRCFLIFESAGLLPETLEGLKITGHFLNQWVFEPRNKAFPQARAQMLDTLKRHAARELQA
ncbi:MAG: DNA repair protein RecO [Alphaproteobacteria bacterium]|nr:DNA repair protein RecO [Alphaproteobacteria bacterium]